MTDPSALDEDVLEDLLALRRDEAETVSDVVRRLMTRRPRGIPASELLRRVETLPPITPEQEEGLRRIEEARALEFEPRDPWSE